MSGWTHSSQQPVLFSLGKTMQIWFQRKAPWKENKLLESGLNSSVLKLLTAEKEFRLGMLNGEGKRTKKERRGNRRGNIMVFSHQMLKDALRHNSF